MALKMMELSEEVLTPDGKPIKVSFHSLSTMWASEALLEHVTDSALRCNSFFCCHHYMKACKTLCSSCVLFTMVVHCLQ